MTWQEVLTDYAQTNLTERVKEALYGRGVSEEQIVAYRIGYLNHDLPDLEGAEAFLRWSQGKLDDVLVLPLTTTLGVIQGFQFRHVDRERKGYQNFMPYKEEALLFGLAEAMPYVWRTGTIYLVEGAFDLFPIQRHFPGVVATLTAKIPENLVPVMRRLVHTVWVGYDADPAGKAATKQIVRELGSEFSVRPVYYPPVKAYGSDRPIKDPGELWEAWGDDQFGKFIQTLVGSTKEFADG